MTSHKPPRSIAARLVSAAAERIAADPRVPHESRAALRACAETVIWGEMSRLLLEGERMRVWMPKASAAHRKQRDQRIHAALCGGEMHHSIARREAVSVRHVERIKARREPCPLPVSSRFNPEGQT